MKRIVLSILTAMMVGGFFVGADVRADDFALGKAAFAQKDYNSANKYFVDYLIKNPNDANARYYYAQTLTYLKNYKQAKLEYGYVIQLAPGTTVANYAKASIAFLDKTVGEAQNADNGNTSVAAAQQHDISSVDNYLSKTISSDGEINTWNPEKMPIKVYIDMTNRPKSAYVTAFKNALSTWQAAGEGMFSFEYTTDPQQAQVSVQVLGQPTKAEKGVLGRTNTLYNEGYIQGGKIVFYTLDQNYKAIAPTDFYNVALHEGGHLLGIEGHSDSTSDIMYPDYDNKSTKGQMVPLSARDKNTLRAMYSLDKNPYATGINSLNRVLGSKNERLNTKLKDELEYAKNHPNTAASYNHIATAYEKQDREAEAMEYYAKALALDPANVYANTAMARIYGKRNDLKNAEIYYKALLKYDTKNVGAYCNLTNLYIRNNKLQLAKSTMNTMLYRNPAAKNDPLVKALKEQLGMQ